MRVEPRKEKASLGRFQQGFFNSSSMATSTLLTHPNSAPRICKAKGSDFLRISKHSQAGLTLVELLVVIVLISLIAVVVGKNVIGQGAAAKAELNMVKMEKLKNLLGQYRLKYNSYPSKLGDLLKGGEDVQKSGKIFVPLATEDELNDVWNFPYLYRTEGDGRSFVLSSLGEDGIEGGDGAKQDVSMKP